MDFKKYRVLIEINQNETYYLLLSMYENEILPKNSVANVIAKDKKNNLIWIAEPPITQYDIYTNIYIKDDKLFAISGGGQLHEIDKSNGKILSSKMIR